MPPHTTKQRIVEDITAQITSGRLAPGARLPTTPQLCETYSTSTVTVRSAVAVLKERGLVEFVPGAGVFVVDQPPT